MKKWVGISLGVHVAVFGALGGRPAPTRDFVVPGKIYSVSLVSLPAPRQSPAARAAEPQKPVEAVKPKPRARAEDKQAIQPPAQETRKPETKKPPEQKKPVEPVPEEKTADQKRTEEPEGARRESAQAPSTPASADSGAAGAGAVAVSALGETSTQGTVSLDAANFGFSYYLVALQAKVAANWFPPGTLGAPGEVLRAKIHFRVTTDGVIEDARVEQSSGIPYFDRCALRAILLASPLAPLPAQFDEDELGVHFEFSHTVAAD